MKQKVLPEIEATLLAQAQNEFTEKVKEERNLWCNGTRKICIKTLHGKFEFYL
jgi:hypothetical protein